jgi:hypothetical protein
MRRPGMISVPQPRFLSQDARVLDLKLLRIWAGSLIWDCEQIQLVESMRIATQRNQGAHRTSSLIPPYLLGFAFLSASLVVFGVFMWPGGRVGGSGYGIIIPQPPVSLSIRDILLAGGTGLPDDLVHNLVPKRG